MVNEIVLISPNKESLVKILEGELISYIKGGEELIHQKGNPGWGNSDTEMFPIVGPTKANNFKVSTKRGDCIQDQHGILRELSYRLIKQSSNTAFFQKVYEQGTKIRNSRFPKKSDEEFVFWPFNFGFLKTYQLFDDSLLINFEIQSEKGMPFMFGYHPAFNITGNENSFFQLNNGSKISIDSVIEKGGSAFPLLNSSEINLIKPNSRYNINIRTSGFDNYMLWTEVKNMVCIEPITQYPSLDSQNYSESNLRVSKGLEKFQVKISPFE